MAGMDADTTPNEAMADNWNGPGGQHWVAHADRHDRALAAYGEAVLAAARVAAGDRVLDVGCGTGALTRAAARRAHDGSALGVDIGQPLVDAARAATAREGGPANVTFERADAQTRPFPAGALDLVISRFGVMFFDDPDAAFANLRQGLAGDGRLVFACWKPLADNDWMLVPTGAIATHTGLPEEKGPDEPGPFALADPERVRALLTGTGFTAVGFDEVSHPLWLGTDLDDAVGYVQGQPLARSLFEGRTPAVIDRAIVALRAALEPHVGPDGVALAGRAWVVTARAA
jgi:SAM-dependent methyltransferase